MTLRFWDYVTSSVTWPLDSPYAVSYRCSIVTICLSCTFMEIFIKPQTLAICKWQPINGHACAHTTSDRTAQKIILLYGTGKLCSKCGEDQSTSDVTILCPRTPDGRTDTGHASDLIFCRTLYQRSSNFFDYGSLFSSGIVGGPPHFLQ